MAFEQLPLSLPYRQALGRADFLVAKSNEDAVRFIDLFPNWPAHAALLCGAVGSGKTHLAHLFSDRFIRGCDLPVDFENIQGERLVIEDIDRSTDETALFHLFNWTKEHRIFVLFTARQMPMVRLPDLKSRLGSIPKIYIGLPDEELLFGVLSKWFYERHVSVDASVLEYILSRAERSFEFLKELINRLDSVSLAQGRRITIPIVRQVLEQQTACLKPVLKQEQLNQRM